VLPFVRFNDYAGRSTVQVNGAGRCPQRWTHLAARFDGTNLALLSMACRRLGEHGAGAGDGPGDLLLVGRG